MIDKTIILLAGLIGAPLVGGLLSGLDRILTKSRVLFGVMLAIVVAGQFSDATATA